MGRGREGPGPAHVLSLPGHLAGCPSMSAFSGLPAPAGWGLGPQMGTAAQQQSAAALHPTSHVGPWSTAEPQAQEQQAEARGPFGRDLGDLGCRRGLGSAWAQVSAHLRGTGLRAPCREQKRMGLREPGLWVRQTGGGGLGAGVQEAAPGWLCGAGLLSRCRLPPTPWLGPSSHPKNTQEKPRLWAPCLAGRGQGPAGAEAALLAAGIDAVVLGLVSLVATGWARLLGMGLGMDRPPEPGGSLWAGKRPMAAEGWGMGQGLTVSPTPGLGPRGSFLRCAGRQGLGIPQGSEGAWSVGFTDASTRCSPSHLPQYVHGQDRRSA